MRPAFLCGPIFFLFPKNPFPKFVGMEERNLVVQFARDNIGKFTKFFDSPTTLWEGAVAYFEALHNNPLYKTEQMKKPGKDTIVPIGDDVKIIPGETLVEMPLKRAATWQGLALFLGCSSRYFSQFKHDLRSGIRKDPDGTWLRAVDMIEDMLFQYNYEGAAAEQFNAMLTARYLGITEKVENKTEVVQKKEVFKIGDIEIEL